MCHVCFKFTPAPWGQVYAVLLHAVTQMLLDSKPLIDPNGALLTSWNGSSCHCGWKGVTCEANSDAVKRM